MKIFQSSYFFQHPYQVWHFFVEVIILFTFISLVVYVYKHSYPFLVLVVPTGTYSYFISFLLSMHSIKCQGAALNTPAPFSLLDNFKYFPCALHRQWHTPLHVLAYDFLLREVLYLLMFTSGGKLFLFLLLFILKKFLILILCFPWSWQDWRYALQSSWITGTLPRNYKTQCML